MSLHGISVCGKVYKIMKPWKIALQNHHYVLQRKENRQVDLPYSFAPFSHWYIFTVKKIAVRIYSILLATQLHSKVL